MKRVRPHLSTLLVLALLVAALVQAAVLDEPWGFVLAPAWTLPLLLARRYPAVASLTVLGALALAGELAHDVTESLLALVAVIAAFWIAGAIPDRTRALSVGIAGVALGTAIVASNPGAIGASEIAFIALSASAPFAGGMLLGARERRASELEHERDQAVADERARIARELHDVIGHAISVMTVQTGAARLLIDDDPTRAREALLAAESAGRQAIGDMHRMLELLRTAGEDAGMAPQPRLADLDALLERVRGSGLAVDFAREGRPRGLEPGVELAAYRVVQEALTNVIKHARGARASVLLRYGDDALELEVANDGTGSSANGHGLGHGLVGMRERVALYDGQLDAGPRLDGGFAVRARLPLGTPR